MKLKEIALLVAAALIFMIPARGQEKKAAADRALYKEIARMDSLMFEAFNTQNMNRFKALFSEDLEWFQDNAGLLNYQKVFETFESNFRKDNKLSRKLVHGSLEVHPIKDYGAIETGMHRFSHMEDGKEVTGAFKFMMIWKKMDSGWKVSKVISYDH